MPAMPDAPVVISAQVFANKARTVRGTGEYQGQKVTLAVHDVDEVAFLHVNLTPEDAAGYSPDVFSEVVWMVRPSGYSIDGNGGMTCKFIRPVNEGDIDKLSSKVKALVPSK